MMYMYTSYMIVVLTKNTDRVEITLLFRFWNNACSRSIFFHFNSVPVPVIFQFQNLYTHYNKLRQTYAFSYLGISVTSLLIVLYLQGKDGVMEQH